ncbi:MAG: histidine kinase, partial [Saprospiraceae bacterium]
MYTLLIIGVATAYVGLLFWVAWRVGRFADKGRHIVNNPYVYSLSLAVYCTAWTFFGSVGRAASGGLNFLAVYLGPLLMIMLWWSLLRKMALISKHQRIASIADFISSRFGKSSWIASVVTLMAIVGVIPYISIQLRAVSGSIAVLRGATEPGVDFGWLTALAMATFTIWFGARKVDPNEQHEGMIAAIALESIVKLGAFLAVGLFVIYHFHGGFGDLFAQAYAREDLRSLFSLRSSGVGTLDWHMLLLISALAIVFLPRQFHVAVVENNNPNHIRQAMWLFPLYLLLINLFVFPVALCGRLNLASDTVYDNYMLTLPIAAGSPTMALLAFL